MRRSYHPTQAYDVSAPSVTDADGLVDYLTRGDRCHLFVVCLTAAGAYVAVLAFILAGG